MDGDGRTHEQRLVLIREVIQRMREQWEKMQADAPEGSRPDAEDDGVAPGKHDDAGGKK